MRLLAAACVTLALTLGLAACGPAPETPATTETAATDAATPVMPQDAPPQEEAPADIPAVTPPVEPVADVACRDQIGEAAAARLVQRCIAVSPATRPPCNAANPCALIQGEIDRACTLFADDPPAECAA